MGPLAPRHTARFAADPRLAGTTVPAPHCPLRQRLPDVEPQLLALVEACLRPDPAHRPTVRELLAMPYFADVPAILPGTPLAGLYGSVPAGAAAAAPPRAGRAHAVTRTGAAGHTHSPLPSPQQPQQQQQLVLEQSAAGAQRSGPDADGRGNGGGRATSTGPSPPVSAAPSVPASEPLSLPSSAPTTGGPQQGQQLAAVAPSTPATPAPPAAVAAAAPHPVRASGALGLMPDRASHVLDIPRAHGPVAGVPEDGVAVRPASLGAPTLTALRDKGMPVFAKLSGDLPWHLAAACISNDSAYEQGRGGGSVAESGSDRLHVPSSMPVGKQQQLQKAGGGVVVGQQLTGVVRGRADESGPACLTVTGESVGVTGQGGGDVGVAPRAAAGSGGTASPHLPPPAAAASEVHAPGGGAGPAVHPTGAVGLAMVSISAAAGAGRVAQHPRLQPAQQEQPPPAGVSGGTGSRSGGTSSSSAGRPLLPPAQSAPAPVPRALGLLVAHQPVARVWHGVADQGPSGWLYRGSNASAAAATAVSPLHAAHGAHTGHQDLACSGAVADRGSSRGGSSNSNSCNILSSSWGGGGSVGGGGGSHGCGGGRPNWCNTGLAEDSSTSTAAATLATACALTSTDAPGSSTAFSRTPKSHSDTGLLQLNTQTEAVPAAAPTIVSYGSRVSGGSGRQGYRTARERRNGGGRNSDGCSRGGGGGSAAAGMTAPLALHTTRWPLPTIFSATGYIDAPAPSSPGPDSNDSLLAGCAEAQPDQLSAHPCPQMPPAAPPGLYYITAAAAAADGNATSPPPLLPEPPSWPLTNISQSTSSESNSGNFACASVSRHQLPLHQPQNPSAASTSAPASSDAPHSGRLSNASLPLADSPSLHNAPPMPCYRGIAPPHRRPAPGESRPWAPSPNGFNSDSLYLLLDRTSAVGGGSGHDHAHVPVARQLPFTNLYRPAPPTPSDGVAIHSTTGATINTQPARNVWSWSGAGRGAGAGPAAGAALLYTSGGGSVGDSGGGAGTPTVQPAASNRSRTPGPLQHSGLAGTGAGATRSTVGGAGAAWVAGTTVSYDGGLLSLGRGQLPGGLPTAVAGGEPPRAPAQPQRSSSPRQNHNRRDTYRNHQGGLVSLGSSESLAAMVAAGVQLTPADAALCSSNATTSLAGNNSLLVSGAAAQGLALQRISRSTGGDRNQQQQQAGAGGGREQERRGLATGIAVPGAPVDGAGLQQQQQQQQQAGTESQAAAAAAEQAGSGSVVGRGGGDWGGGCVPAGRLLSRPRGGTDGGGQRGADGGVEAAGSAGEGKEEGKRAKGGVSSMWRKMEAFVRSLGS